MGTPLSPRQGSALSKVWFPYACASAHKNFRGALRQEQAAEEGGGRRDSGCRQGGAKLRPTDVCLPQCRARVSYVTVSSSGMIFLCIRCFVSASYISMKPYRRDQGSARNRGMERWVMWHSVASKEPGVLLAQRNHAKAN